MILCYGWSIQTVLSAVFCYVGFPQVAQVVLPDTHVLDSPYKEKVEVCSANHFCVIGQPASTW